MTVDIVKTANHSLEFLILPSQSLEDGMGP
jgi:hypothetical protein